jgi:hypothetical protein
MTIEIGQQQKLFSLSEARAHLALVQAITKRHQVSLAPIQDRLKKMLSNDPRRMAVESEYEAIVSKWKIKIEQLGACVQGLWVVEFNLGEAVLCWRYPELSLNYVREQQQQFSERQKLQSYIEVHDPDWA